MKLHFSILLSIIGIAVLNAQKTNVAILDAALPHDCSFYLKSDFQNDADKNKPACNTKRKLLIKSNELLSFQIINTNPFKYNYEINGEIIDFFQEDKSDLSQNMRSAFGFNEDKKETETSVTGDVASRISETTIEMVNQTINLLEVDSNFIAPAYDSLPEIENNIVLQKKQNDSIIRYLQKQISIRDGRIEELEQLKKQLALTLKEIKTKLDSLNQKIQSLEAQIEKLKDENEELKKQLSDKMDYALIADGFSKLVSSMAQLAFQLEIYVTDTLSNEDYLDIESFKEKRRNFIKDFHELRNEETVLDLQAVKMSNVNQKKYKENKEVFFKPSMKGISTLINRLKALKLNHYTLPIEFDGENIDAVVLTVKRTLVSDSKKVDAHTYKVWVKEGFKFDVSAGIFISFLENRAYTLTPLAPTSSMMDNEMNESSGRAISRSNNGTLEYGFGTLLNVSYRTGKWIKPTFNFGIMFTDETKFQLLSGLGVIFGKKERIILSGGIAVGRVTTLLEPYKANGETLYNFNDSSEIPTVEKLDTGFFLGLTYNLGKTNTAND